MNISDEVWRFLGGILIIAILVVLVRPNSPAATAVTDLGKALQSLVAASVA